MTVTYICMCHVSLIMVVSSIAVLFFEFQIPDFSVASPGRHATPACSLHVHLYNYLSQKCCSPDV